MPLAVESDKLLHEDRGSLHDHQTSVLRTVVVEVHDSLGNFERRCQQRCSAETVVWLAKESRAVGGLVHVF